MKWRLGPKMDHCSIFSPAKIMPCASNRSITSKPVLGQQQVVDVDLVARAGRQQHVAQFVERDRRDHVVDRPARAHLAHFLADEIAGGAEQRPARTPPTTRAASQGRSSSGTPRQHADAGRRASAPRRAAATAASSRSASAGGTGTAVPISGSTTSLNLAGCAVATSTQRSSRRAAGSCRYRCAAVAVCGHHVWPYAA